MGDIINKINLLGMYPGDYLTPFEKVMEFIKIFVTIPMIVPLIMVLSLFLIYGTKGKKTNKIKIPIVVSFMGLISCIFLYDKYSNILALVFFSTFLFLFFYTVICCIMFVSKRIKKINKKKINAENRSKIKDKIEHKNTKVKQNSKRKRGRPRKQI